MSKVLVCQIGARRHYAVPRGLHACGLLQTLVTDACSSVFPWSLLPSRWHRLLPSASLRKVVSRNVAEIPRELIQGRLFWLLSGVIAPTFRSTGIPHSRQWAVRNQQFCEAVNACNWKGVDTVYGYNGAALEVFRRARQKGLRCVLDQTAAAWRFNTDLLRHEMELHPQWEVQPADLDLTGEITLREEAEWRLADRIVCGSQFVVDSIRQVGGPAEKCVVVPYPIPTRSAAADGVLSGAGPRVNDESIRVLFAGTLQLRKGIQYFLRAAEELRTSQFEFRAVGPSLLTQSGEDRLQRFVHWQGSVPRNEMKNHYEWADVMVLPTLSEGSANVCWEALSCSLPVITTVAAGVTKMSGVTIVEPNEIVETLRHFRKAQATTLDSQPTRSVSDYGADLARVIHGIQAQ